MLNFLYPLLRERAQKYNLKTDSLKLFRKRKKENFLAERFRIFFLCISFLWVSSFNFRILGDIAIVMITNGRTLRRFEKGFCAWHTFLYRETYSGEASAKWVSISNYVLLFSKHSPRIQKSIFSAMCVVQLKGL